MKLVEVNGENHVREHVCCALADGFDACAAAKKAWMRARFGDGLTFWKLDERGKVFIEYIPAGCAWAPVEADGYMHINCFWVSGKFKGLGWANRLLMACIEDSRAKGCLGLTAVSSAKKRPFLSDGGYLRHKGFRLADTAAPYFELLYLPFSEDAPRPRFSACAREGRTDLPGLVLYYSDQCPHAEKYALLAQGIAEKHARILRLSNLKPRRKRAGRPHLSLPTACSRTGGSSPTRSSASRSSKS